jgi:C4-dicarboxylate transporter DctQ subunit
MKRFIANFEKNIMCVLLPCTCAFVVFSTFGRYTGFYNMYWAEELIRYLYIFVAYLGISMGVKSDAHFRVQLFVGLLPKSIKNIVQIISDIIIIVFLVLLVYHGGLLVRRLFIMKQTSPMMKIPMFIPYMAIPIGCFTMCARVILRLSHDIKHPDDNTQEEES